MLALALKVLIIKKYEALSFLSGVVGWFWRLNSCILLVVQILLPWPPYPRYSGKNHLKGKVVQIFWLVLGAFFSDIIFSYSAIFS